jgi:hypothetical protein
MDVEVDLFLLRFAPSHRCLRHSDRSCKPFFRRPLLLGERTLTDEHLLSSPRSWPPPS